MSCGSPKVYGPSGSDKAADSATDGRDTGSRVYPKGPSTEYSDYTLPNINLDNYAIRHQSTLLLGPLTLRVRFRMMFLSLGGVL